jgi:NADH-quinone oxidoreductase subunit D
MPDRAPAAPPAAQRRSQTPRPDDAAGEDARAPMALNFGPQHPSTHGVLRIVLEVEGETVVRAAPDIGYLHRGKEKLGETLGYHRFMPYTDRLDYLAPLSNNCAFALAAEKICGIEAPPRAQTLRVICCELARISSHLLGLGAHAMDLGAMTVFLYTFEERETLYNLFEFLTGARFTTSYARIGGVVRDATDDWLGQASLFASRLPARVDEWERLLTQNRIWRLRNEGIGVISREKAISFGLTGPCLRGSGVPLDLRKDRPYFGYERFDFEVPVGTRGDCYDRYLCRLAEMRQSARIVRQAVEAIERGPILADAPRYVLPPKAAVLTGMEELIYQFMLVTGEMETPRGEAASYVENPKGIHGYYLRSEGGAAPWRMKIRAPSFANLSILGDLLPGHRLSDVVAILASIDFVMGEADK